MAQTLPGASDQSFQAFLGGACSYKDTSERFTSVDARPEVFVNVCPDPTVLAASRASVVADPSSAAATSPPMSIPLDGMALTVRNEFSDRQPDTIESQMKYVAENLLPKDYFQAALEHNRMGQGYVTTYMLDKPFQGIQLLREEIPVPAMDGDMFFGAPYVGPYNTASQYFSNADQISDPRYKAPASIPSTSTRVPIAPEGSGGALGPVGAPGTGVALRKLGAA